MATGPLRQAMGPPRSGAGVGVGMLRGAGDSLTWKYWFLGFWFIGFKDLPNFHSMFSGRYWSHIQDFPEFIKRIVGSLRCPSFPNVSNIWICCGSEPWTWPLGYGGRLHASKPLVLAGGSASGGFFSAKNIIWKTVMRVQYKMHVFMWF